MDDVVDLDVAVRAIEQRIDQWHKAALVAGRITWRDQGEGYPPPFKTDRSLVEDADSIGIALRKGDQGGEVVLFEGGWCDFAYWSGRVADDPEQHAPGFPDRMTVEDFGAVLDRLASSFDSKMTADHESALAPGRS